MVGVSSSHKSNSLAMAEAPVIQRAILSVSDKTGLPEFARGLSELGIELYSTGGTRAHLREHGLDPIDIAEYTGFPEILDGRVKTLHPKIFGGILFRRDRADDVQVLDEMNMKPFDLVVVNLYPFQETIARADVTPQTAIEQIDIGGPSLVRAAAKNSAHVTIATSPGQYGEILDQLRQTGGTSPALRQRLMVEAFEHTAAYDERIATYFASAETPAQTFPQRVDLNLKKAAELRYGENSHQAAAVYSLDDHRSPNLVHAEKLNGKELSFNNYLDLDAALGIVQRFEVPACCVIKHNNPCGAASGPRLADVCRRAMAGDPVSAFGSILGFNRPLDLETAEFLSQGDFFVEAVIAPDYEAAARELLTTRPKWKKNVRLIRCDMRGQPKNTRPGESLGRLRFRQIHGGMLVQQGDDEPSHSEQWKTVTGQTIDAATMQDLGFAWEMVRHVKSNAIVLAQESSLVGVGAGQMSRVDAVRIAIEKAGNRAPSSVLASDAFFPFPDSVELAAQARIKAVIQPGGSVQDEQVIQACRRLGVQMVFTGRRHFLH